MRLVEDQGNIGNSASNIVITSNILIGKYNDISSIVYLYKAYMHPTEFLLVHLVKYAMIQ